MRIIDIPEFKDKADVLTFDPDAPLLEVVDEMAKRNFGAIIATKDERVVGVFSERDLLQKVVAKRKDIKKLKLSDVLTAKVHTARAEDTVVESMRRMSQGRFRHLPIVDEDDKVVGIVSQGDFVTYTWADAFNRISSTTKQSFFTHTQVWMIFIALLIYTTSILLFVV